ncbi:hypothetical protein N7532_000085 [Penicillium argentinense]|uniref:Uncharacterized protein n=1 Tax=Penicillium argentinense TaxID=1131581 RepID=A0A9W9G5H7_9EURO|nr:uncharacterized protein N7532_000085 [Penicillium argentinense]KAJ5112040.1 hypothetical protein N7532_000085 [Penicillium argentinense]
MAATRGAITIARENKFDLGPKLFDEPYSKELPISLVSEANVDSRYLGHFFSHVQQSLHPACRRFTGGVSQPLHLRYAMLCLSASSLSMLDTPVQSRVLAASERTSVFSPLVNPVHDRNAVMYNDLAVWYLHSAYKGAIHENAPSILVSYILLALYHHASTDHEKFRLAVTDSVKFVIANRGDILNAPGGTDALQMWFRLCTSHRPSKSPALLLEGQGVSSSAPNLLPDVTEHLYMSCILGMSTDDLIYDILIKTLEIRTKLVVSRCVADCHGVPEQPSDIGILAYETLNTMLGRPCTPEGYAEARKGFLQSSHLFELLNVQKERLAVWRSRLRADQLPCNLHCPRETKSKDVSAPQADQFYTHRDTMNALYCRLCEITFDGTTEFNASSKPSMPKYCRPIENLADSFCEIASTVNPAISNTSDVYTLSLAESLLQLVQLYRSDKIFTFIFDTLWPRLEATGKGYEHSHYPTHLVKRIVGQIGAYWNDGHTVELTLPAVPEDIPKYKLLDVDQSISLVVCGHTEDGTSFMEKRPLA